MLGAIGKKIQRERFKRSLPPVIRAVRREKLSYLGYDALNDLYQWAQRLEQEKIPGALIEAGCALGGSAIVLATAKAPSRPFYVYDVFGLIPPPSENDDSDVQERYEKIKSGEAKGPKGTKYYGYEENLLEKVTQNFAAHSVPVQEHNVKLVKGLFEDVMHLDEPVALAHIDGDWYNSVLTCLERITPHLVPGGVLVIDDYDDWSGCRKAVDEYFADKKEQFAFERKARLHIVRR